MNIKLLRHQGMSIHAIARLTGHTRPTIRRALRQAVPANYPKRPAKAKKLDPFLPALTAALAARPWVKATTLYKEIAAQGFAGHYELVKVWVRQQRQAQSAATRACVRFETAPGEEAQVDWKGPVTGLLDGEPQPKVWLFRLVLAYSRYRLTRAVTDAALPSVLADLIFLFERLGALPHRLVFDNFKAAVLVPRPRLKLHPFFVEFCSHYGIEPCPALPYSPQRKGKVERSFLDTEQAELLHRRYANLAALQAALDDDDARSARQVVSSTGQTPLERLERERPFLLPLPEVRFDPRPVETRRVLSDCTISFAGAYYSVPHRLVGQRVLVKADPRGQSLDIFHGCELVARHERAAKGSRVIEEAHVAELRRARWDRPQARQVAGSRGPSRSTEPQPALVAYPEVAVAVRQLQEYERFVEEVAR